MARLEDLTRGASLRGIVPHAMVTVIDVQWYGSDAVELTYKDAYGQPGTRLLYRDDEAALELVTTGRAWSFDGDGHRFRLIAEAHRIRLAHLFDPVLAVHTSLVEPLPHQITAVYETMLRRQPLRFLLADDPGAGKTIMAGLLIKELIARGDVQQHCHHLKHYYMIQSRCFIIILFTHQKEASNVLSGHRLERLPGAAQSQSGHD